MANRPVRVILDTNIWISLLITNNYAKLDALLFSDKVKLIFSKELLSEFISVAQRPKFKKYFSLSALEDLINILDESVEFIQVKSNIKVCRDPKDVFLLSLALDGNADYLVSGDYDLLDLKRIGKTEIINITDLAPRLDQEH